MFEFDIWGSFLVQRKKKNKLIHFFLQRKRRKNVKAEFLRLDIRNYLVKKKNKNPYYYRLEMRHFVKNYFWNIRLYNLYKLIRIALKKRSFMTKSLIKVFETRLDAILWRTNFFKTVMELNNFIKHKNVLVNKKIVTFPSINVIPGDVIFLNPKYKSILYKNFKNHLQNRFFPSKLNWFLEINYKFLYIIFSYYPLSYEVSYPFASSINHIIKGFLK